MIRLKSIHRRVWSPSLSLSPFFRRQTRALSWPHEQSKQLVTDNLPNRAPAYGGGGLVMSWRDRRQRCQVTGSVLNGVNDCDLIDGGRGACALQNATLI